MVGKIINRGKSPITSKLGMPNFLARKLENPYNCDNISANKNFEIYISKKILFNIDIASME